MSVAPGWRDLPPHLIPRRLRHSCGKAQGNNKLQCWRFGDGPFRNEDLTSELCLDVDSATHGTVQPRYEMTLETFEIAIAATRSQWTVDEA